MKYHRIVSEFLNTPWAIMPDKLASIANLLADQSIGIKYDAEEIQNKIGAIDRIAPESKQGAIAVIPVRGTIVQRANMFDEVSGVVSADRIAASVMEAVNDNEVSDIILDMSTPGGSVYGIAEAAEVIYKAREHKRVIAVANSLAASAGYWLGAAASELVVTPGGEVGSIGVITAHADYSKFIEAENMPMQALPKITFITSSEYKSEGNAYEPLSDEAKASIQARVNEYDEMFVDAIARYRNTTAAAVKSGFGKGRVVGAQEAVNLGMADRIATLSEVLGDLRSAGRTSNTRHRASVSKRKLLAQI